MNEMILYTTEDGKSSVQLRADGQTVWLTQLEMGELFSASKQNISLHLKNIFEDGELMENSVVKESLTTATDGKRYSTKLYNLDAILAVGYRVRSARGVQFRVWASSVLKEYLVKGFALANDYDKKDQTTQQFYATVQNLLLYAVTEHTAAEIVLARANQANPHFGLLSWQGSQVRKQDILIAKNYLTEDEIDTLNRLTVIFLETAELRAKRRTVTTMAYWKENIGRIITANGFPLLAGPGSVSHGRMEQQVAARFIEYDLNRKAMEAHTADVEDEEELRELEEKVNNRKGNNHDRH